jgi:hypothetical protein
MAQQKIQAGGLLDVVTRHEMEDALGRHLRSWVAETARGGRFTRFSAAGTVASSAISIGGSAGGIEGLGPAPGFVWDVRRLHITGLATADIATVSINDSGPTSIVGTTTDLPSSANRSFLWNRHVVLYPGDNLLVVGSGLAATGSITVSGQVLELPVGLAWKLSS